jgi:hypothetical protein
MKKSALAIVLISIVACFPACKKSTVTATSNGAVLFFNACTGTGALGASANGSKINDAGSMSYLKNSAYMVIPAGAKVSLAFLNADGSTLTGKTADLSGNSWYSIFACGTSSAPLGLFTQDNLVKPASGFTKVRFVNLCTDGLQANCTYGGTKVATAVSALSATAFFELAPGAPKVVVSGQSAPDLQASVTGQSFAEGKSYSVIFTGSSPTYQLTVINNY